jgi:hypothetical protein
MDWAATMNGQGEWQIQLHSDGGIYHVDHDNSLGDSDSHQLLTSSLQRLDKSVGASDASSVPVVYGLSQPGTPSMASPIPSALIDTTINKTIRDRKGY